MKSIYLSFILFTGLVLPAMAQVTVKDIQPIDKDDIAVADFDTTDMAPTGKIHHKFLSPKQESDNGLADIISVSINNSDDLNMEGYLETSSSVLSPKPIVIPFFEEYPIQNIEVKLRILNRKF